MKQLLLLTAIITIFNSTLSAQIKKGSILLGGQIGFIDYNGKFSTTQNKQKNGAALFNISAGTAISENKVLGIAASYYHTNDDYANNGSVYSNTKYNRLNIDAFYRLYKKLAKDLYLFGEIGAGYIGSDETSANLPNNTIVTKYMTMGGELYVTPGVAYRIYKKLQVELVIPRIVETNYTNQKRTTQPTSPDDYTRNGFYFNSSLNGNFLGNLALGFKFVL
jgi:hypothetical protein